MKAMLGFLLGLVTFMAHANDTLITTAQKAKGQFVIRLAANPTTGYQWVLKNFDKQIIKPLGQTYLAPDTKLIGAGGQSQFAFKLLGTSFPEKTTLTFQYARSWEKKSVRDLVVIVIIK